MFSPRPLALLAAAAALGALAPAYAQPDAPKAPVAKPPEAAPEAPLSERDRLARGKALYEAGSYGQCVRVLRGLLGTGAERALADRDDTDNARLYYAACLLAVGQPKQADVVFRQAIRDSPQLQPNPLEFPRPVVDRFGEVRKTMLDEIEKADRARAERAKKVAEARKGAAQRERAREQKLLRLASEESVVVENSRWVAVVPFGVGQFQNRSSALGWLLLTTELLALGTTVGGLAWELELQGRTFDSTIDRDDWNRQISAARTLWTVSLYSFAGLALTGIVEAQLSFEPSFERTRRRRLPPELRSSPQTPEAQPAEAASGVWIRPMAQAQGGGLGLVFGGRF